MPGYTIHVLTVDTEKNSIGVQIDRPESEGGHGWPEDWNLEHTLVRFDRGEYREIPNTKNALNDLKQTIDDYYKTRRNWEAEALKKRQFPVGGVVMPHHYETLESRFNRERKKAIEQIMADIEKKTIDALNTYPKEYVYIPSELYEEYSKNAVAMEQLKAQGKRNTLEFERFAKKAEELSARMQEVKKEAIEKEAADKMAKMVADAMKVADSFVKAAKAIRVFNQEVKETDAVYKKFSNLLDNEDPKPADLTTLDEKGFFFLCKNGKVWWCRIYLGAPWALYWAGNGWVTGKKLNQTDIWEAGETRLPEKIDKVIRKMMPVNF